MTGRTNVNDTPAPRPRVIPRREAQNRLGVGRSTLYDWNDENSPSYRPEVPQPIKQGGLSGFIEHEIDEYILGLMRARGGASEQ